MDVLIIGGTGLISSKLARILTEWEHNVTVYHRGETEAILPDVTTIHGDRTQHAQFEEQMGDVDVDCVIDMWCMTPNDAESAVQAFDSQIEQFVFCSTVDVYRTPPERYPLTEDLPRIQSGEGYAPDKAECERIFEQAHRQDAFEATIVRPGYTYGEGRGILTPLGFQTDVFARLRADNPIVVHGDGTALWGACHRDDVARAFANAVGEEATYGERYHITSQEWMTWNQYFRRAAATIGAPGLELVHIPTELLLSIAPDDRTAVLQRVTQHSYYYDNSKAASDLNFEYTIEWTRGVERVVNWLDEHDEIGDAADPVQDRIVDAWHDGREAVIESIED